MDAALQSLTNFESLSLIGDDSVDFCHRIFTRDIRTMGIGDMKLSLLLNAEARIQNAFWVCRQERGLMLITSQGQLESMVENIEKYIFSEKIKVLSGNKLHCDIQVLPEKSTISLGNGKELEASWRAYWRGLQFSFSPQMTSQSLGDLNLKRIQHLIPIFGTDYSNQNQVFDLGFEELCDQNKGCYIGQEIVERVKTRGGRASKKLCLVKSHSRLKREQRIHCKKHTGEFGLTSVAYDPNEGTSYGLSILPRQWLQENLEVDSVPIELLRVV